MRAVLRGGVRRRLATISVVAVIGIATAGVGLTSASADEGHDSHHVPEQHTWCIPVSFFEHGHFHFDMRWFHGWERRFDHRWGWLICQPPATTTTTVAPPTTQRSTTTTAQPTTTTAGPVTTTTADPPTTVPVTTTTAEPVTTTTADPPTTVDPPTTTTTVPTSTTTTEPCPGRIVNGVCVFVG